MSGRVLSIRAGLAVIGLLLFAGGCVTSPDKTLFIAGGPGWTVQEGQALWRPRRGLPEFAGDIVLASNPDGRRSIDFSKEPLPLVLAQTTKTNWLIQFPPRRLGFTGGGHPPQRFAWLILPAALAGEKVPAHFVFTPRPDGGWRLENQRTGESIEGFLSK